MRPAPALALLAFSLLGTRPASGAELAPLASSPHAVVIGQPEARSMAPYVAHTVDEVMPRAAALTGCDDLSPVPIRLYTDVGSYRDDAKAHGMVVAKAMASDGVVFVLAESPRSLERLNRALAHEVAHVMVWRTMRPAEQDLPLWVNEGVAQWVEGSSATDADGLAAQARRTGQLIPMSDLVWPAFQGSDTHPDAGRLAYAESLSLVSYLIHHYGEGVVAALLQATRRQGDFDAALKEVTGLSPDQLEAEWQAALPRPGVWIAFLDPNLLMWAAMVVLLLAAVVRYWIVRRRREAEPEGPEETPVGRRPLGW